ncbi:caspase family protein [Pseudomonas fluorescens]|nr:caspase family protein [Pseudomonas fluorescens]
MGKLNTINGTLYIFETSNGRIVNEIQTDTTAPFANWCFTTEKNIAAVFNGELLSYVNVLDGNQVGQLPAGPFSHCFPGVGPVKVDIKNDDTIDISPYTSSPIYKINGDATTAIYPVAGTQYLLAINEAASKSKIDRINIEIYDTSNKKALARADNLIVSKSMMEPNSFALDMRAGKLFYLETDFESEQTLEELERPKKIRAYDFKKSKSVSVSGITNKVATGLSMMRNGKLVISNESNNTWLVIDSRNKQILLQGEGEIDGVDLNNGRDSILITPFSGSPYFSSFNKPNKALQLFQKGAMQDLYSAGEHVWISSISELRYANLKDLEIQSYLNKPHSVLSFDRTGGNILVALLDESLGKILSISPDGKQYNYTFPAPNIPTGMATRLGNGWLVNAVAASDSERILREMENDIDHVSEGFSNSEDMQSSTESFYYFIGDDNVISPPIKKTGIPDAIVYSPRKKIVATKELENIKTYSWPDLTPLQSVKLTRDYSSIYLTPDANVLIATGTEGAEAISLETGLTLDTYTGPISQSDIVVKNDDTAYLTDGNTLALWKFKQENQRKSTSIKGRTLVSPDFKTYVKKSQTGLVFRNIPDTQTELNLSQECLKPIKWTLSSKILLCETTPAVSNHKSYVTVSAADGKVTSKVTHFGIDNPLPLLNTDGSQVIYITQVKETLPNSVLSTFTHKLITHNTLTNAEVILLPDASKLSNAAISETGDYVVTTEQDIDHINEKDQDYKIRIIRTSDGQMLASLDRKNTEINSVAVSNDGSEILLTGAGVITKINAKTSEVEWSKNYPYVIFSTFTNSDKEVLALAIGGTGRLLSMDNGNEKRRYSADSQQTTLILSGKTLMAYRSASSTVTVEYEPPDANPSIRIMYSAEQNLKKIRRLDATHLILVREDEQLSLYDESTEAVVARMFVMGSGGWVVATADGRFDSSNMDEISALHWVSPKNPGKAMPIEIFLSELYEPQLLWKVLKNEKLATLPSLQPPQTSLPIATITSILQTSPEMLEVTVEAKAGLEGENKGSQVADIKLFRNNKLIGTSHLTDRSDEGLKTTTIKFPDVQLPQGNLNENVNFSVYAFNRAGLKGPTSNRPFTRTSHSKNKEKNIYLITIGVNDYSNPAFNLDYAASDATQLNQKLTSIFRSERSISQIYAKSLISPQTQNSSIPTKENIRLTLENLSKNTSKLPLHKPEGNSPMPYSKTGDSVIIFYSGHGYFSPQGELYIFPSDIAKETSDKKITENLLTSAISTSELAEWLENIDAEDITLILDACHSAGAVGSNFRPGPLASKGLGQLAYDKGMRILAATQSDSVALETEELKHGYLSYALINDGLDKGLADFRPADGVIWIDEWLAYGRKHVPELASGDSMLTTTQKGEMNVPRLIKYRGDVDEKELSQRPVLYNFSRTAANLKLSQEAQAD